MKILYECDLAGSRYHGMAHRIYQFSKEFVEQGHEVMIIAASYSHARRKNPIVTKVITDEVIDGIQYRWIKTPSYRGNGIGRVIHLFVYNFRLWWYADKIAEDFNPEIVISSGVSPLDFIGCNRIARRSKAKTILEVGDLWPLSPIELGGYSRKHPFIKIMQWAEDYSYKNVDSVISLLPCAKEYMIEHGLKSDEFNYVPNGIIVSDWENPLLLPSEHMEVLTKLRNQKQFLIGYAGAHGQANSLKTIINSVATLEQENISLVLLGSGQEKEELIKYVKRRTLSNVYFLPPIEKQAIPSFLKQMDVLYIGLQKQSLFRFGISPNKMFDYMMAGKPIVQAIEAGNNLVEEAKCGFYAEPENSKEIGSVLLKIRNMNQNEREQLGENGKQFVLQNHSYDVLTKRFLNIMINLIKK